MKTRRLGNTDLELTAIGLGTWAIGGSGWQYAWGAQDDDVSVKSIVHALELGVNWIDTAAVYGMGHSEEVVGRAVREFGRKPIIATKCGRVWHEDGTIYGRLSAESVRKECEDSLKRLQMDRIDLYQIHWPDPDEYIEEAWATVAELVGEGKVRYAGVSNFAPEHMDRIRSIHPVASDQPPYSMFRRGIENDLLDYCREKGIGIVAYSPMAKGLLTGKYDRAAISALPEDDHRKKDPMFRDPALSANLEFVDGLKRLAAENGKTCAQLALAWTLRRPEITSAITGTRRPSQIEETVKAADWDLGADICAEIDRMLEKSNIRGGMPRSPTLATARIGVRVAGS